MQSGDSRDIFRDCAQCLAQFKEVISAQLALGLTKQILKQNLKSKTISKEANYIIKQAQVYL